MLTKEEILRRFAPQDDRGPAPPFDEREDKNLGRDCRNGYGFILMAPGSPDREKENPMSDLLPLPLTAFAILVVAAIGFYSIHREKKRS